ncbi:MAG TPA: cupredoxin domain-containing protein [Gemmatimonadaceae bacterium]|nr:cupredoxin domain-containing protein [Gemmatimonadaceae bacterium]
MNSRFIAVLAVTVTAAACGGGGGGSNATSSFPTGGYPPTTTTPVPANTMLVTTQLTFNPTDITVAKGTSVAFVIQDTTHQIYFTGTGKPADLPPAQNTTQTRGFDNVGSYGVYCKIHSYMRGSVTVQ